MTLPHLKKHRLLAGLTQAEVAIAMGIAQPSYQRWETGATKIPKNSIRKLAKVLGTTIAEIEGTPLPFDYLGIQQNGDGARSYFGEIVIHFNSGNPSLLLPISEKERDRLYSQLEETGSGFSVESLDNQVIYVRRAAVTDIFLSSDAYDDYGPEHGSYEHHLGIYPDDDFWHIVEFFEDPTFVEEDYGLQRTKEVFEKISLSEEDLNDLVAKGHVTEDSRAEVREEADKRTAAFYARATTVTWQLSSGKKRQEYIDSNQTISDMFSMLERAADDEKHMICLPAEGYHRSIFINPTAIDFISVPAHKLRDGFLTSIENDMDSQ
ncbi:MULTISPECIES: helix-turn-helix transcriptional regulator [unclassified Janthinobacterium]|uniref:helix-turn-helix domain-containing protein n=1 Tax=unclassified Janthinobacterium TaxID=2610881 RepID=UPI001623160D|nr:MULTISPECIES: helix-turn-helix transcriptional regulator [unclassified Janthinobacterium]MBB5371653.1 transcriptional regulator with XRE-family HTH domain [Janthinobacterium sp. K2C7]MBB5384458.1 transcriptional regulator with XRE-family HTH domain [Janthinobacterium sp. K2Li3]MBB5389734.1 transcriptional regulator with XRE-family HTH domain [Janthinobacterium sp. K2E3]